jgi:hypothetical protein
LKKDLKMYSKNISRLDYFAAKAMQALLSEEKAIEAYKSWLESDKDGYGPVDFYLSKISYLSYEAAKFMIEKSDDIKHELRT